ERSTAMCPSLFERNSNALRPECVWPIDESVLDRMNYFVVDCNPVGLDDTPAAIIAPNRLAIGDPIAELVVHIDLDLLVRGRSQHLLGKPNLLIHRTELERADLLVELRP